MDNKTIDEEISRCLTTISDELYSFHDETVRILACIEHIEYL